MNVIAETPNYMDGKLLSVSFLFEDDVEVTLDLDNNVIDMDGIGTVSESRKKEIEGVIGGTITT